MEQLHHFARTLRPQKLADVIGQDFVVSMLQNSIYLGKFFPVYLFFGQRGCGKTTVARIIASMINCTQLENFQKHPRDTQLPCTQCPSCIASQSGSHPDFIEIDAASHTGVDHVRTILESAHYLPLMGRKKIYLIDEAHMLSKAAFNALLKMLEEPPATALFILATTEINKIPITVRSRSFQGIFNAPERTIITAYLKNVAHNHHLQLDDAAADLIATKADRCVRDALNLLEQIGSLHKHITDTVVLQTFGMPDKNIIIEVLNGIIEQDQPQLFTALDTSKYLDKNPTLFWNALSEGFQSLVRANFGAPGIGIFTTHEHNLKDLGSKATKEQLALFNSLFWQAERTFNATTNKHLFIEHFLTSLCSPQSPPRDVAVTAKATPAQQKPTLQKTAKPTFEQRSTAEPQPVVKSISSQEQGARHEQSPAGWDGFLQELSTHTDKIPFGIFKRASMQINDAALVINIPQYNSFLEEQLSERSEIWRPLAHKHLPAHHSIVIKATPMAPKPLLQKTTPQSETPTLASRALATGPTTDLILKYFPGKLV